jgi:hypothetical protein
MFGLSRLTILVAAVILAGICLGITVGIAQTLPPSSDTEEKIRQALDGKATDETGDGVLDDVLGVIKSRGSILDGSSLDPDAPLSDPPASGQQSAAAKHPSDSTDREKSRAAELLLKTARKLEEIRPGNRSRREMVKKMRSEAVKLLSE